MRVPTLCDYNSHQGERRCHEARASATGAAALASPTRRRRRAARVGRKRLQAGVPRAWRVYVDVRLVDLLDDPLEELTAVLQRRLELLGAPLAQAPVEVELLLEDAEVDLVVDRRRPGEEARAERLAQRDRVEPLRHRREEPLVELDRLELDLTRDALDSELLWPALDRLDVERRHHLGEIGHVR